MTHSTTNGKSQHQDRSQARKKKEIRNGVFEFYWEKLTRRFQTSSFLSSREKNRSQKLKIRENHRYEKRLNVNKHSQTSLLFRYHKVNSFPSVRWVVSTMSKRTSNDAIVFRTLVSDFWRGPAVQVYYRGMWFQLSPRRSSSSAHGFQACTVGTFLFPTYPLYGLVSSRVERFSRSSIEKSHRISF